MKLTDAIALCVLLQLILQLSSCALAAAPDEIDNHQSEIINAFSKRCKLVLAIA